MQDTANRTFICSVVFIDLVGSTRLRQCAGDNCALLFLDTSRPGKRRWCSMERCGNRNKVREFRSRAGVVS